MIDLKRFSDDIILATSEVMAWTGKPRNAILRSRIPPVGMHAREKHFRASDVKKWILEGDRAFEHRDGKPLPSSGRSLRLARTAGA
jgi:hypothetical protein